MAELLNYQLRLFRPGTVQLVGGSGPEDLDLGAFRSGDAVIVIGFAPYSTASVSSSRAARRSGAALIAIADSVAAPMAEGADHLLLFEAATSPGFFPSLTGAVAQSLAAVTFVLGGVGAKRRLEETEARLAACCREGLNIMGVRHSHVLHRNLRETPPMAVGGDGVWLIAEDGRRILEGSGGAAVSCLGHQHPRLIAAISRQVL